MLEKHPQQHRKYSTSTMILCFSILIVFLAGLIYLIVKTSKHDDHKSIGITDYPLQCSDQTVLFWHLEEK